MVMSLPQPECCSIQIVEEIVAERQKGANAGFFTRIAEEWQSRVNDYIQHGGSPEHIPRWAAAEVASKKFINLYLSAKAGSTQRAMLQKLRDDHDLIICPSCGEAGRPNTLDHYLPKTLYPHFSVTPLNLFPMCDACQQAKGAKTGNAVSPKFFIHPYFDDFVTEQIIHLIITAPFVTPTFRLIPNPDIDAPLAVLIATHMRELKIEQRYAHFFRSQHRRLLRLVGRMRSSGQDVTLGIQALRESVSYPSENSWEHIFYSSILSNHGMLDYLSTQELPTYL